MRKSPPQRLRVPEQTCSHKAFGYTLLSTLYTTLCNITLNLLVLSLFLTLASSFISHPLLRSGPGSCFFFLFLFFMYTRVHILGKYYRGVVGKSPMGNSSSSIFPGLVSLLILLPQGFSTRRSMERTRCIRLHPLQNININTFCKSIRGVACGYVYFDFDVGVRLSLRDLL